MELKYDERKYRRCFKCGVIKPMEEYHKSPGRPMGHVGTRKECVYRMRDERKERRARTFIF